MKKLLIILIIILLLSLIASYFLSYLEISYKDEIDSAALKFGLDKHLVYAVIHTESNFKKNAVSVKGASGLMQLTSETALFCAEKMGDVNLVDQKDEPSVNINMGCFYLSYLLKRYKGAESTALAAYNAGPSNADSWLKDKTFCKDGLNIISSPFPETDSYMKKVAFYKKVYKLLY